MQTRKVPVPNEGFVLTHFVMAANVDVTSRFYSDVLGGEIVFEAPGLPTMVKLANSWIIINVGGGPTPDKADVILEMPADTHRVSSFINIRVANIDRIYEEWSARGAEFLTPPLDNGGNERRCYLNDPDGRVIEVGQPTGMLDLFSAFGARDL